MKQREERVPAHVPARLRGQSGWSDATITNISEHGLCFVSNGRYERGHYLELRRGSHVIIARIVWSADGRCGAQTQDTLPVFDIINDRPAARRKFGLAVVERRRDRTRTPDWQRQLGQRLQFASLGLVGLFVAVGIGQSVYSTLSTPFRAVEAALVSGP